MDHTQYLLKDEKRLLLQGLWINPDETEERKRDDKITQKIFKYLIQIFCQQLGIILYFLFNKIIRNSNNH